MGICINRDVFIQQHNDAIEAECRRIYKGLQNKKKVKRHRLRVYNKVFRDMMEYNGALFKQDEVVNTHLWRRRMHAMDMEEALTGITKENKLGKIEGRLLGCKKKLNNQFKLKIKNESGKITQ